MDGTIKIIHGSGGVATSQLIQSLFYKYFDNTLLRQNSDAAVFELPNTKIAFTTDSYVITPLFFPGGNIGKLAICGTVNDLAVSGSKPLYLSCGFILEEGLSLAVLEEIVKAMGQAACEADIKIITGDTKVVPKGCADGLFINTSGIGEIKEGIYLAPHRIQKGDKVIITGTIADHGTAILLAREKLPINVTLKSDCAPLGKMLNAVCHTFKEKIHMLRDPTRGGIATTLNELIKGQEIGIRLREELLPITDQVSGVCEMLGLEPLYMANEGKAILICEGNRSEEVITLLKTFSYGKDAAVIGEVVSDYKGKVFVESVFGTSYRLTTPLGDQLPRIC